MQNDKKNTWLIILLYGSILINLRYYTTIMMYSDVRQELAQISMEHWRLNSILSIYIPMILCMVLAVVLARYMVKRFWQLYSKFGRIIFLLWAVVALYFPIAVNKAFYTLPFSLVYGLAYLLLSWGMIKLGDERK